MSDAMPAIPQSTPQTPFEQIKQVDADGNEFWSARDLMPILEYKSWQKFKNVLIKAQIACENSGNDPDAHFIQSVKIGVFSSGTTHTV